VPGCRYAVCAGHAGVAGDVAPSPTSVAVLVELERGAGAGGHVKCWENLAAAATEVPDLDLTVYVLARRGPGRTR